MLVRASHQRLRPGNRDTLGPVFICASLFTWQSIGKDKRMRALRCVLFRGTPACALPERPDVHVRHQAFDPKQLIVRLAAYINDRVYWQ